MRINGPWKVQGAKGQVLSFSFKFQNSAGSCILESKNFGLKSLFLREAAKTKAETEARKLGELKI